MKVGLGLYRHMLKTEYYDFARQAGCTHVIIHLVESALNSVNYASTSRAERRLW
jgi:hypothetical protein